MRIHPMVVCADGFSMSVQAHGGAYCSPRVENAERYDEVEIGFPNESEPLILQYMEGGFSDSEDGAEPDPTQSVYPYVPAWIVSLVLAKHGGIVEGEVPPGVAELRAPE
jgi:hypothetical protein